MFTGVNIVGANLVPTFGPIKAVVKGRIVDKSIESVVDEATAKCSRSPDFYLLVHWLRGFPCA